MIYFTETLTTLYILFWSSELDRTTLDTLKKASLFWCAANLYQVLWCIFFRKIFLDSLYMSTTVMALSALSLIGAHNVLTEGLEASMVLTLTRIPIAIHASWLVAATFVNVNIWVSLLGMCLEKQLALAFLSAYLGVALGCYLCISSGDVSYGLTFAWSFYGLSDKTQNDCEVSLTMGRVATQGLAFTEKVFMYVLLVVSISFTYWSSSP